MKVKLGLRSLGYQERPSKRVATPVCHVPNNLNYFDTLKINFPEITCQTDGATIWVSLDGGFTWQEWVAIPQVATPISRVDDTINYFKKLVIEHDDIYCPTVDAKIEVSLDNGNTWQEWSE